MLEFEERGLTWREAKIAAQNRYQMASFSVFVGGEGGVLFVPSGTKRTDYDGSYSLFLTKI